MSSVFHGAECPQGPPVLCVSECPSFSGQTHTCTPNVCIYILFSSALSLGRASETCLSKGPGRLLSAHPWRWCPGPRAARPVGSREERGALGLSPLHSPLPPLKQLHLITFRETSLLIGWKPSPGTASSLPAGGRACGALLCVRSATLRKAGSAPRCISKALEQPSWTQKLRVKQ